MDARSTTIVAVSAVLGFLATLVVALRFWARHLMRQKFGVDDALLVFALLLTLGVVVIDIIAATWSRVGEHEIFDTDGPDAGMPLPWEIQRESITLFSIQVLHTCTMPAIKAYTLAFYLRIFVSRGFKKLTYAVGAYVFCWWVAVILVNIFQCQPVSSVSLISKCLMGPEFLRAQQAAGVLNVLSDFVIIVMPIPVVMRLHMPMQHKVTLVAIFLTGSLVLVAGIARTVSYFQTPQNEDFSYHDYYFLIWTSIEPCMALIGASIPACRPVFHHFSPESLIGSIRSAFSLRSVRSRDDTNGSSSRMDSQRLRGSSIDDLQSSEHVSQKFELEERVSVTEV